MNGHGGNVTQHSRRSGNEFAVIVIEDLTVKTMIHNSALAKSTHDVAWGQRRESLAWQAACAARRDVTVNPAYTSQDCSGGGPRKTDLTLADRIDARANPNGLLVMARDRKAAQQSLARGRACLAQA
jgi:putative transposase